MQKRCLLSVIVLLFVFSDVVSQQLNELIPKDYDTLYEGTARGDLNKDGIEDIVLALYHHSEDSSETGSGTDEIPPRKLLVLFGSKSGYVKAAESSASILCKNCGGIFGDPFAGISISKNVLTIHHYGGSAWRWGYTHKFRFQGGGFYLIGKTSTSYWNVEHCDQLDEMAGLEYEDINYVTGSYEKKKISTECKLLLNKKGKQKLQPLVSLTKFTIEN